MMNRMMVALGAALVCVGSTLAQKPEAVTVVPTPVSSRESSMPHDWWAAANGIESAPSTGFWVTGDFLYGWFSGDNLKPLITTSPAGTARAAAGVGGSPTTQVLFGDHMANDDSRIGFRLGAGYWLDAERTTGIEAGFSMLESQATFFSATSDGSTILARPFFNVTSGLRDSTLIAFPGSSSGSVFARASSGNFYEGHLDLTESILNHDGFRIDGMLGYRFYRYDEGLHIRQSVTPTGAAFVTGTQIVSDDNFNSRNEFHAGDFGVRTQIVSGNLSVELLTKLAVGCVNRGVDINGSQVTTVPGVAPVTQVGGVSALVSNIGSHTSNDWTIMPEFGVNLSWQVTSTMQVSLGYSVLLLDQIARASDQVDPNIIPGLFPPANTALITNGRPAFNLVRNDLWLQSVNLGMKFSY